MPLDVDGVAHEIGESYRQTRLFNPIFMEKLPIKHLISAMTPYWSEAIKRERAAHGLKPLENTEYYARFILGGMFEPTKAGTTRATTCPLMKSPESSQKQ